MMQRLGLRFSSPNIENDYITTREPFATNFLKHLIGVLSFFLTYSVIIAIINKTGFTSYHVVGLILVLILILKFSHRLKRFMDIIIVVISLIIYGAGLSSISKFLENNTTYLAFYIGFAFSVFQRLVESRVVKLPCTCLLYLGFFGLRLYFIRSNFLGALLIQIALEILILISNFERERSLRKLFRLFYDYKQEHLKFKHLITNYFPVNIVIFDKKLERTLFVNDSFQNLFQCREIDDIKSLIRNFAIDLQSIEDIQLYNFLPSLPDSPNNLEQMLQNYSQAPSQDNYKIFSFNVKPSLEVRKEVYQTKLFKSPWEDHEAIVLMFNDMTQQATILELKISDKHKDEVIQTVSHELRTPINAILGFLRIIEKMVADSRIQMHLAAIKYSSNLLLSLVNSILDLTQIRANCIRLNCSSVNLTETLEEIKRMFSIQCEQKGIKLVFELAQDLPRTIWTDQNRFSQIIINLLNNALKFTFEGSITLKVQNDSENHRNLRFSVSDTGIGIKDEDKDKLFKMFGKLIQRDPTVNTQGVGLGLTISNELVGLLNPSIEKAKIEFQSEYSKGTTFLFPIAKNLTSEESLPLVQINSIADLSMIEEDHIQYKPINSPYKFLSLSKSFSTHNPSPIDIELHTMDHISVNIDPKKKYLKEKLSDDIFNSKDEELLPVNHLNSSSAFEGKRLTTTHSWCLLVDDNPFNLMVGKHVLQDKGYNVKTALNGKEAIKIVEDQVQQQDKIFKFILMDCQMPVMDGFEASRNLTEMMEKGVLPKIPIIALSASNADQDIEMGRKSGMCGFLVKPLDEGQLMKLLDSKTCRVFKAVRNFNYL